MSLKNFIEPNVQTVTQDQPIHEIAKMMREFSIGNVVVVDKNSNGLRKPIGMVTDRDIVTNALANGIDQLTSCTASDVMSKNVICVNIDDDLQSVIMQMRDNKVGRVPVLDANGALCGILTSNRIFSYLNNEFTMLNDVARRNHDANQSMRPELQTEMKTLVSPTPS